MSTISLPKNLQDGTTAFASDVMSDLNTIVNDYNGGITTANIASGAAIAASKLSLSTVAQTIGMSGAADNWADAGNLSSATTTNIGATAGNKVNITGVTTITAFDTIQAGTVRFCRFTGILTLTHNGTSLILPTAANITTAAGDCAIFISEGSGNWRCWSYQRANGTPLSASGSGTTIQTILTQSSAASASSGTAFDDDTIPQLSECPILTDYNTTITASSASNTLVGTVVLNLDLSSSVVTIISVFLDSATSATCAMRLLTESANRPLSVTMQFKITPADTSAHTYKIGIGTTSGTAVTVNGAGGNRKLGGVLFSSFKFEEIKA